MLLYLLFFARFYGCYFRRTHAFFFRDIAICLEVSMSQLTYGRLFHKAVVRDSMEYEERDSNSQAKWQQNLNLPRLPLPPSSCRLCLTTLPV